MTPGHTAQYREKRSMADDGQSYPVRSIAECNAMLTAPGAKFELEEIEIIREFLPKQLTAEESEAAIDQAVSESGAQSLRDMGKVMAILKERYRGQLDMATVGPLVKGRLGG